MRGTPEQRLLAKVVKGEHWLWQAATNNDGYGNFYFEGKVTTAHRAAYQIFVGPVLPEEEVDHICRVRLCVRPDHLAAVTKAENHAKVYAAYWENPQTHCKRGHELTEENVYVYRNWRTCKTCRRGNQKQARRKKRK